jgi:hypothetical protein
MPMNEVLLKGIKGKPKDKWSSMEELLMWPATPQVGPPKGVSSIHVIPKIFWSKSPKRWLSKKVTIK